MSDYFDRVERQIVRSVEAGLPQSGPLRRVSGYLGLAAAVIVVIVVAGALLLARGGGSVRAPGRRRPAILERGACRCSRRSSWPPSNPHR